MNIGDRARPLESERFARQLAEIGLNMAMVAWRRPRLEGTGAWTGSKETPSGKNHSSRLVSIGFFIAHPFGNPSYRNRPSRKQCRIWLGEKFLRPRTRKGIAFAGCQLPRAFGFKSCIWPSNGAAEARRNPSVSGYLATPYESLCREQSIRALFG